MNEVTLALFNSILSISLLAIIGYFAQKARLFGAEGPAALSRLVIYITFPCLSFHSMLTNVDPDTVMENLLIIGIGILMVLCGCIVGFISVQATNLEGGERATFVHMLSVNNYVFLPLPIVIALWPGQEGTLFLLALGCGIGFWTIAIFPLVRGGHPLRQLKHLFNPPLIGMVLGLTLAMTGMAGIFDKPVLKSILAMAGMAGGATVPLALLFVGASLALTEGGTRKRVLAYYCGLRLLLFPLVFIFIIKAFNLPQEVGYVVLVVSMMPSSNTSTMVAARYGGSAEFAGAANLWSTPLALITVPIFFPVLQRLLEG